MKKRKSGGGYNWMDTYGDMVTLLLCFFVLLYSISTVDKEKWEKIVKSFNPDAIQELEETVDDENDEDSQDQIDVDIEQLFQNLKSYVSQQGEEENISVTKGSGYVFISFNEAVFFDGDSYVLREDGKKVLYNVGKMLGNVSSSIDEVRILGHTAQASPNELNNTVNDRFLSSNRATAALVYLQNMNILDPARLISMGYGQWRPVASNDTVEGRVQNRRVEMIVAGKNIESSVGDSISQYYTQRGTSNPTESSSVDIEPDLAASNSALS